MVKLNNQPTSPVQDTAAALRVANSVAVTPGSPELSTAMKSRQSPVNTVPETGGHPWLKKYQRSVVSQRFSEENELLRLERRV